VRERQKDIRTAKSNQKCVRKRREIEGRGRDIVRVSEKVRRKR
jgi:hypothetical protein